MSELDSRDRLRTSHGRRRHPMASAICHLSSAFCLLLVLLGCRQGVTVQINSPRYKQFSVPCDKPDRRYWESGRLRVFPSGSRLSFRKGGEPPRVVVVDDAGASVYEETLERYPMAWYEALLTPLFGLGYALWQPYEDPYGITPGLAADERLRQAAAKLAPEILARLPAEAKAVGVFTVETDIVEKGLAYASEGNRRLSEYLCNCLRELAPKTVQVREFKMGVSWYLKHTYGSLGASAEARRELIAKFARTERVDMVVYGKNYLYPQQYAKDRTIHRAELEFDILLPKEGRAEEGGRVKFTLAFDPGEKDLAGLFLPPAEPGAIGPVAPPSIEVVLERAALHIARDLLEKVGQGTVLATYPKPIFTYVSDFAFLAAAPLDERVVVPNKYGAYLSGKVEQNLAAGSTGLFAFVERKKAIDVLKGVPDRGKTILVGEMSAWIDPSTAPQLGRMAGVKVVFFGDMQVIGADLKITVTLQDLERRVKLATVEHVVPLDVFLHAQFISGNLTLGAPGR
ncbi:MAG: hypothetical protein FJ291_05760 [Planctomycetes bacterium]|nr:hypothetical protein [Planctomycetota bacterium]